MYWKIIMILPVMICMFQACNGNDQYLVETPPMDHQIWDELLKEHVDSLGSVSYIGFEKDRVKFESYLTELSTQNPKSKSWSSADKLAFWINAYNAFTIKLIIDHWEVESIKDIKKGIPFVNSVWDIKFITINNQVYDLNKIEHQILRKDFNEPRIHFAINCASISCPKLRNEAFQAEILESQLEDAAISFINDIKRNEIKSEHAKLSKIFRWFKGDFVKEASLIEFINQYSKIVVEENAEISYLNYNWNLNI